MSPPTGPGCPWIFVAGTYLVLIGWVNAGTSKEEGAIDSWVTYGTACQNFPNLEI
jgi:hypothetical protein